MTPGAGGSLRIRRPRRSYHAGVSDPASGNPFEGMGMFGELARILGRQGPVSWEIAQQISLVVATEGQAETNVDPLERIRYEELLRVAELHAVEATGLSTSATGGILSIVPVGRGEWVRRGLDAYRPLLEHLSAGLNPADDSATGPEPGSGSGTAAGGAEASGSADAGALFDMMGSLGNVFAPVLVGMQSGFMLGQLARRMLGQYDLPIPRPASDELLVVPANLSAFAEQWSLPLDDLRLWVCLHEILHHAVLARPHVRRRLEELVTEYVSNFRLDPGALETSLGDLDPSDPSALQSVLGSPEALLGAVQTDAQRDLRMRIATLTIVISAYVDHFMDGIGHRLIGSYDMLTEALRRRRVEASESDRFAEHLLGIGLTQAEYNRGTAFIAGVVERAGDDVLARLWEAPALLPTPAELDAPGLWLARIELDSPT